MFNRKKKNTEEELDLDKLDFDEESLLEAFDLSDFDDDDRVAELQEENDKLKRTLTAMKRKHAKDVAEFEEKNQQLQSLLSQKQEDIERLTNEMLSADIGPDLSDELQQTQAKLQETGQQLAQARQQIEQLQQQASQPKPQSDIETNDLSKEDIAQVMVEARIVAKQILTKAEDEAEYIRMQADRQNRKLQKELERLYQRAIEYRTLTEQSLDQTINNIESFYHLFNEQEQELTLNEVPEPTRAPK